MAKKETATPNHTPSHGVFVVESDGPTAHWTRIGCAWPHADGHGFNISLTAVPLSGRLVIRARVEKEAGR
jgi:hypothetical protein